MAAMLIDEDSRVPPGQDIDREDISLVLYEHWDPYAKGLCERSLLTNARGLKGRIGQFALNGMGGTLRVRYTVYPQEVEAPIVAQDQKKRKRDTVKLPVDLDNDDDDNENEQVNAALAAQACGRLIARGPSVQHVKRNIRHLCFYTTTHDIDQVHPHWVWCVCAS